MNPNQKGSKVPTLSDLNTASSPSMLRRVQALTKERPLMNIVEFCTKDLGVSLFPVQRFTLKVATKMPLDNTIRDIEIRDRFNQRVLMTFTEQEYYDYLLKDGRVSCTYEEYCESEVIQILLAWGRRGSKSTVIVCLTAYKLYQVLHHEHPQVYFGILENDMMNIIMVALGEDSAGKLFSKFWGVVSNSKTLRPHFLEEPTSSSLKVWTKNDIKTRVKNISRPEPKTNSINIMASPNTPGLRGENNFVVIMEEAAHYNTSSKSTRDKPLDEAIYEAITPSVSGFRNPDGSPFGQTYIISSPNGTRGMFHREFAASFELGAKNSGSWSFRAPTWEVNPTIQSVYLRSMYNKSPNSFAQEYGAAFNQNLNRWITDMGAFYRCVDPTLTPHLYAYFPERVYFAGFDFALSNDGTGATVASIEKAFVPDLNRFVSKALEYDPDLVKFKFPSEVISLEYCEVRYAGVAPYEHRETLHIEEILDWVEEIYFNFPIRHGIYDQWSGEIIKQMIEARGIPNLSMVQFNTAINDTMYKLFMESINTALIRIPDDEYYIDELLNLQEEIRTNGVIKVEAIPGPNNHDDLFDASARAIYLAYAYLMNLDVTKFLNLPNFRNVTVKAAISSGARALRNRSGGIGRSGTTMSRSLSSMRGSLGRRR